MLLTPAYKCHPQIQSSWARTTQPLSTARQNNLSELPNFLGALQKTFLLRYSENTVFSWLFSTLLSWHLSFSLDFCWPIWRNWLLSEMQMDHLGTSTASLPTDERPVIRAIILHLHEVSISDISVPCLRIVKQHPALREHDGQLSPPASHRFCAHPKSSLTFFCEPKTIEFGSWVTRRELCFQCITVKGKIEWAFRTPNPRVMEEMRAISRFVFAHYDPRLSATWSGQSRLTLLFVFAWIMSTNGRPAVCPNSTGQFALKGYPAKSENQPSVTFPVGGKPSINWPRTWRTPLQLIWNLFSGWETSL